MIFLLNLIIVKRERNEKEKKISPWFLLFKSLLLNQSLFWGRHSDGGGGRHHPIPPQVHPLHEGLRGLLLAMPEL